MKEYICDNCGSSENLIENHEDTGEGFLCFKCVVNTRVRTRVFTKGDTNAETTG